jgi:hypothetical protein
LSNCLFFHTVDRFVLPPSAVVRLEVCLRKVWLIAGTMLFYPTFNCRNFNACTLGDAIRVQQYLEWALF